jgi:hypothetical protein
MVDMEKAMRVAVPKMVLSPQNIALVSAVDASYAKHPDGKSHTGEVVRFESDTACSLAFGSSKEPIVAKWVGEAELISHEKVGDLAKGVRQLLGELGYKQENVRMKVDGTCECKW